MGVNTLSQHTTYPRHPSWLKVRLPGGKGYGETLQIARKQKLHTVCEDARCPNVAECWGRKTATFMILGDICTRACAFCNVKRGRPTGLDTDEPRRTAEAISQLGIKHAVITSVDRDDLEDGGAEIFAETVREIRKILPSTTVEVLVPDFKGSLNALSKVWKAHPDVFGHNLETVPRLYSKVRCGHRYERSIKVLADTKELYPSVKTKTNIMLGHGETLEEVYEVMGDLVKIKLDGLTITQYLQPSRDNLPVMKYYHPDEFVELRKVAIEKGIPFVQSGPLVRSSYRAEEVFKKNN